MDFMIASEKNYKICQQIIEILHENEISVSQSRAILEYAKNKIARDTKVGMFIPFEEEDY